MNIMNASLLIFSVIPVLHLHLRQCDQLTLIERRDHTTLETEGQ